MTVWDNDSEISISDSEFSEFQTYPTGYLHLHFCISKAPSLHDITEPMTFFLNDAIFQCFPVGEIT